MNLRNNCQSYLFGQNSLYILLIVSIGNVKAFA